jgi:molybdenum cofactor cytidylyltransferase
MNEVPLEDAAKVLALIPAAGKSRRMGRPKLKLPLGGRSLLERVLDTLRQAGLEHILVVAGPDEAALPDGLEGATNILRLEADTADMRATVQKGLSWLESCYQPGLDDAWLLLPADHPTLNPVVITTLLASRRSNPAHSIFIPTHESRRGHPALIGWGHVAGIRSWPAGQGLNTYFRAHQAETYECPVSDPGVLLDLDTPDDYQRLLETWQRTSSE